MFNRGFNNTDCVLVAEFSNFMHFSAAVAQKSRVVWDLGDMTAEEISEIETTRDAMGFIRIPKAKCTNPNQAIIIENLGIQFIYYEEKPPQSFVYYGDVHCRDDGKFEIRDVC